jgi:hypothetical protein
MRLNKSQSQSGDQELETTFLTSRGPSVSRQTVEHDSSPSQTVGMEPSHDSKCDDTHKTSGAVFSDHTPPSGASRFINEGITESAAETRPPNLELLRADLGRADLFAAMDSEPTMVSR